MGERLAVGVEEQERVALALHRIAALVNEPVVEAAELAEVVELRVAAVSPMDDVMPVDPGLLRAAREDTAAVARAQRAVHLRRDRARLAADRQRVPVLLDDPHEAAVTGEPARDRLRQRLAAFELAEAAGGGL